MKQEPQRIDKRKAEQLVHEHFNKRGITLPPQAYDIDHWNYVKKDTQEQFHGYVLRFYTHVERDQKRFQYVWIGDGHPASPPFKRKNFTKAADPTQYPLYIPHPYQYYKNTAILTISEGIPEALTYDALGFRAISLRSVNAFQHPKFEDHLMSFLTTTQPQHVRIAPDIDGDGFEKWVPIFEEILKQIPHEYIDFREFVEQRQISTGNGKRPDLNWLFVNYFEYDKVTTRQFLENHIVTQPNLGTTDSPEGSPYSDAPQNTLKDLEGAYSGRKMVDFALKYAPNPPKGTKQDGDEVEIRSNGGFYINLKTRQWNLGCNPGDPGGVGIITLASYLLYGENSVKGQQFTDMVNTVAEFIGYTNDRPQKNSRMQVPEIYLGTKEDIRAKTFDVAALSLKAWNCLKQANLDKLYLFGNEPVYVEQGKVVLLTKDVLESTLNTLTRWQVAIPPRNGKKKITYKYRLVPPEIPKHMLNNRIVSQLPLPKLQRVVHSPYIAKDGTLHITPGYNVTTKTLYYTQEELRIPAIPQEPSPEDVEKAKDLIHELIFDFPFVGYTQKQPWNNAEIANTVSLFLEPYIREWFPITPLYVVEAPTEGTGKTLLPKLLLYPALGEEPAVTTAPARDEEWKKLITSVLVGLPPVVFFDNIEYELKTQHLNAALTSSFWKDRKMGGNTETLEFPNMATWVVTGNNPQFSKEIVRRTIRIRLEASLENPSERDEAMFRHPNIWQWVKDHRSQLVWAALVLIQNYLAQGRPESPTKKTKGGFEQWAKTMNDILAANKIIGFLDNTRAFQENNEDPNNLKPLLDLWLNSEKFPNGEPALISELYLEFMKDEVFPTKGESFLKDKDDPPISLYGKSDAAKKQSLGKQFRKNKGRVFTLTPSEDPKKSQKYRLTTDKEKRRNRVQWKLESLKQETHKQEPDLDLPF